MSAGRLFLAVRLAFGGFVLFTSLFAVLAYVPFTYENLHKGHLIPALTVFARWHHSVHLLMMVLAVSSLALDRPVGAPVPAIGRRLRALWVVWMAAESLLLLGFPAVGRLQNNIESYVWALVLLAPLALLAAIDWIELLPRVDWARGSCAQDAAVFRAAWQSALVLTLFSTAWAYVRLGDPGWAYSVRLYAAGINVISHLVVLMLFFAALNLVSAVASWFDLPARFEFLLCHLFGALLLWQVLRGLVFPTISFSGTLADAYAGAFALVLTAMLAGLCLRVYASRGGIVESGLALAFWLGRGMAMSRRRALVLLAATGILAGASVIETAKMDWNYLVQKVLVLVVWIVVFRLLYQFAMQSPALRRRSIKFLLIPLAVLAGYRTLQATQGIVWKRMQQKVRSEQFLEQYSGYDASFRLIHNTVSPAQSVDPDFYRYLARNTNIPRSVEVKPVEVKLVENLAPAAGPRPNIFLFVIDSLRQDYLAPYNSRVSFTPAIAAFGQESVVFQKAFTHYGGTGLSEPSIWTGGMLLHKQYVTPFGPMNALEKLLRADGYKAFVSRDVILETILAPWPKLDPLDATRQNMDYDLCTSLEELQGKIASEGAPREGLFAYTQPQNIHISKINREGAKAIDGENYGGFYAPCASRLRRIDGCFGKFIAYLKQAGIYDHSIVILTADHGDSLGEEGRWGHAYTIYPEILRIPLIVHLPLALRGLHYNPSHVTFSTDITPSLYYLLGHRPVLPHAFQGRPLFTEKPEEQGPYRHDQYLIASSYAAVYGILSGDGTLLFVSDGVNYRDSVFDLNSFTGGGSRANASVRAAQQAAIRGGIQGLAAWYRFESR